MSFVRIAGAFPPPPLAMLANPPDVPPMSQPQSENLLTQLDSLQDYVLDELDALDARINDLIKQLVGTPSLQAAPAHKPAA